MTLKEALLARVKAVYISEPIDPMQGYYGVSVEFVHPTDPNERFAFHDYYTLDELTLVKGDREALKKRKAEDVAEWLVKTYEQLSTLAEPQAQQRIDEALDYMQRMAYAFEMFNNDWTLKEIGKVKKILKGERT